MSAEIVSRYESILHDVGPPGLDAMIVFGTDSVPFGNLVYLLSQLRTQLPGVSSLA
jgi:hypothetical protein